MADYRTYPPSTAYQPYDNFQPQENFQQQQGLREESISIIPSHGESQPEKSGFAVASGAVPSDEASAKHNSYDFSAPPAKKSDPSRKRQKRLRLLFWGIRYFLIIILVIVALVVPIVLIGQDIDINFDDQASVEAKQYKNLAYYLLAWLLVTWVVTCIFDIFILAFPYLFRVIARYVNVINWGVIGSLTLPVMSTLHKRDIGESSAL